MNSVHINEFQEMMRRLYFQRDSERGVKGTYERLVDELRELGEALEKEDKKLLKKSSRTSSHGLRLWLT